MLVHHNLKLSILIVFGEGVQGSYDIFFKHSCLTSPQSLSLT